MRIAVDARPLGPPLTGIGFYTASVLEQLFENSNHEWFLYLDRAPVDGPWNTHPQVVVRHKNATPQSLQSLKIANWDYLQWARQDKIDLFWSPRHHLPFFLPRSCPSVVTIHDLVWRRFPETMPWQARALEWAAMSVSIGRAQRVIADSRFTADEIEHFYPSLDGRCSVVHLAGRALKAGDRYADSAPYFLFVGTHEPRKNLITLLSAMAQLQRLPHRLLLTGASGWGGVDVLAHAAELGISEKIEMLGYVEDAQLGELYSSATALVMPSLYEGFGLPVVEAMSLGCPVIVSDRASLPEVAGDAGLIVDPESADSVAQALARVAADEHLKAQLSSRSFLRAESFSWHETAEQTLKVLEQAAA